MKRGMKDKAKGQFYEVKGGVKQALGRADEKS